MKTKNKPLTSEQRCRKAFDEWAAQTPWRRQETTGEILWTGWLHCWKYLQSQAVKEFIER